MIDNSGEFTFELLNHTSRLAYYCKMGGHFEIHVVDFLEQNTSSFIFKRPKLVGYNPVLRSVE